MFDIAHDLPTSHDAAAQPEPSAPVSDLKAPVPTYDPFSDEELWRRVGEVIAKAAQRPPWSKP